MDTTHDGNALGNKPSDVDDMVQYWNEITKRPAFDFYWAKLEGASGDTVDLDVLRICVRLLPLYNKVDTVSIHQSHDPERCCMLIKESMTGYF